MAVAFIYQEEVEQSRQNLFQLFNKIPDSVIMLSMTNRPTASIHSSDIVYAGNLGVTHYSLKYLNKSTDTFFGESLSSLNSDDLLKSGHRLL
jgi:hypothetical protein